MSTKINSARNRRATVAVKDSQFNPSLNNHDDEMMNLIETAQQNQIKSEHERMTMVT